VEDSGFFPFYSGRGGGRAGGRPVIMVEKQPAVMVLTPLMAGQLKEGLRGNWWWWGAGGGVKARRRHLEVLSGGWNGRRWWKAVAVQPGSGGAGGR
jgi:hypothetical protein